MTAAETPGRWPTFNRQSLSWGFVSTLYSVIKDFFLLWNSTFLKVALRLLRGQSFFSPLNNFASLDMDSGIKDEILIQLSVKEGLCPIRLPRVLRFPYPTLLDRGAWLPPQPSAPHCIPTRGDSGLKGSYLPREIQGHVQPLLTQGGWKTDKKGLSGIGQLRFLSTVNQEQEGRHCLLCEPNHFRQTQQGKSLPFSVSSAPSFLPYWSLLEVEWEICASLWKPRNIVGSIPLPATGPVLDTWKLKYKLGWLSAVAS